MSFGKVKTVVDSIRMQGILTWADASKLDDAVGLVTDAKERRLLQDLKKDVFEGRIIPENSQARAGLEKVADDGLSRWGVFKDHMIAVPMIAASVPAFLTYGYSKRISTPMIPFAIASAAITVPAALIATPFIAGNALYRAMGD